MWSRLDIGLGSLRGISFDSAARYEHIGVFCAFLDQFGRQLSVQVPYDLK